MYSRHIIQAEPSISPVVEPPSRQDAKWDGDMERLGVFATWRFDKIGATCEDFDY